MQLGKKTVTISKLKIVQEMRIKSQFWKRFKVFKIHQILNVFEINYSYNLYVHNIILDKIVIKRRWLCNIKELEYI